MSKGLNSQQKKAVRREGRVIVSASAGSGKTTVMIERICRYIKKGGDIDDVLAITFTVKAAANMKQKLRDRLLRALAKCPDEKKRVHISEQISKVNTADISTIHSFCGKLIRTYFYKAGIDSAYEIITENDGGAMPLRKKAADDLFSGLYEKDDEGFRLLLECFREKRRDESLKRLMTRCYEKVRNVPDYRKMLEGAARLYEDESGFDAVCADLHVAMAEELSALADEVVEYRSVFDCPLAEGESEAKYEKKRERYEQIFDELEGGLRFAADCGDVFEPPKKLKTSRRLAEKKSGGDEPGDVEDAGEDDGGAEDFAKFCKRIKDRYAAAFDGLGTREEERARFYESGRVAVAFSDLLLKFDDAFSAAKAEEGVMDYGDLEHYALKLLEDEEVKEEIRGRYKRICVDEFQDVNPVQDRIIGLVCGDECFFVGDRKQAIYGFRGCSSAFFTEKFAEYGRTESGDCGALTLAYNYRSRQSVLDFVNNLFSDAMTLESCGINYSVEDKMYPPPDPRKDRNDLGEEDSEDLNWEDSEDLDEEDDDEYDRNPDPGSAVIDVIGRDEKEKAEYDGVYSVMNGASAAAEPSRQGLAVVRIVREELKHFRCKDICVLTRKHSNADAVEILRALKAEGWPVSTVDTENACAGPEGKALTDIVSYLDDYEQDIPLCSFLLSPAGGFTEGDLAEIRAASRERRDTPFRRCADAYAANGSGPLAEKLRDFYSRRDAYRRLGETEGAGPLIDRICLDAGWSASFSAGSGRGLRDIRAIRDFAYADGQTLSVAGFLRALKDAGGYIAASDTVDSDSIKMMTMHASKGLEFPVIIIPDLNTKFTGGDRTDVFFDDAYGFAPMYYDAGDMTHTDTVLTRLCRLREERKEVRDELNLLYVACTRAEKSLHVILSDVPCHHASDVFHATSFARLADFSKLGGYMRRTDPWTPEEEENSARPGRIGEYSPDDDLKEKLDRTFERPYAFAAGETLPVKCTVTRLTRREDEEETPELYLDEYETEYPPEAPDKWVIRDGGESVPRESGDVARDRGTAYHRFLELAEFDPYLDTPEMVEQRLTNIVGYRTMSEEQAAMLDPGTLTEILCMPVFDDLRKKPDMEFDVFCERQFICSFPACELEPLGTDSRDPVLVQGVIDLLAIGKGARAGEARVIDYKYSSLSDDELAREYAGQVELYRRAVAKITGLDEKNISTTIVNIKRQRVIRLHVPGREKKGGKG